MKAHVARMGKNKTEYRILMGNTEGRRPLGRQRRRWMDTIKMKLGETEWGDVDLIDRA
jgi:hypothetical protein